MRTAVQLRSTGTLRCELLHAEPAAVVSGALGPIVVVAPDRIVAYQIRTRRGPSVFVFRTLTVDDAMAAWVPGVQPHVRLLVHVRSVLRARRVQRLLAYLVKRGPSPSLLSDGFYLRVSHMLGGRAVQQRQLLALVRAELRSRSADGAGPAERGL